MSIKFRDVTCNHEHVTPYFKRTEEGIIRCAYCESKI